jgi:uncharacterized protein with NRDE domain
MCTLAIYVRQFPDVPLVVAANRDEFFARPATPPVVLAESPRIVGGRDLRAGGTWLGVSEHGVVAGLLNRRTDTPPDPTKRSRGILLMEVLAKGSASEASSALEQLDGDQYNAFNLLVADAKDAWVAQNKGHAIHMTALDRGVHVITNLDVNDPTCPKIARSHRLFQSAGDAFGADHDHARFRDALQKILSDHTTALDPRLPDALGALCVHTPSFGTRCSSLIFATQAGDVTRWHHWFADGPPCTAAYADALVP